MFGLTLSIRMDTAAAETLCERRARLQSPGQSGDPAKSPICRMRSDTALGGGRSLTGEVGSWLDSHLCSTEAALRVGADLAATVRDFALRRVSACGPPRIRVSGMSDSWLRMHETEYDKRRTEF